MKFKRWASQFFGKVPECLEMHKRLSHARRKPFEDVLRAAVALFSNQQPSKDRQTRWQQLETIDTMPLDKLDRQLYDCLK